MNKSVSHKSNPCDCVLCPGWCYCFMDLLLAGFQHCLLCHISSSSSHLCLFFFLEAALLSGFASSLSSIALMHLVRLSVSESQLSHFWITEPSRVCAFYLKPHLHRSSSLTFSLTFFFFFSWDNGSYSQKASYSKPSPHPSPCSYEWRRKIMISEKGSRSIILCASVFMHHWLTLERAEVSTPLRTPSTV